MRQPPYPKYKQTGVEWLGEIPEHWDVKPLKRTFSILNGATPKSGNPDYWDGDIPWATPDDLGSLSGDTLKKTRRMITHEGYQSCGTSLAPSGSLVLSTRAPIGHLAIAGIPLCTNQGCRCLVFREKVENRFYYYQLLGAKHELESWGQGSTFRELGRDRLAAFNLVSPPINEQRAITAFLDRESARINALIEKKQKQIELLQEKRTVLINHTVTKGIDPNAKMKDSGIEWLGEIPEHWEIKRLKRIAQLRSGDSITSSDIGEIGEYPVYGGNGLRGYTLLYTHEGEFILIGRQGALCGCINFARGRFWATEHAVVVTPIRQIALTWLGELLRTMDLNQYSQSAAQPGLSVENIEVLFLPVPPVSEQHTIAAFLEFETSEISGVIKMVEQSIEKLCEYRIALISAAVTGKIDVRNNNEDVYYVTA